MKTPLLSDAVLLKIWEDVFEKGVYLDHKPTASDILLIRLRAIAAAQRDADMERNLEKETLNWVKPQ